MTCPSCNERRPISVAALVSGPAHAEPLYCSMWQGIRSCSSPSGYTSTETQWQGMTTGQDSDGNRWTTSRWRDETITTVKRPGQEAR